MKKDYGNSQRLDAWWRSTMPEIRETADFLFKKIPYQQWEKYKKQRVKEHLKVILTNLNVVNKQDDRRYIAISMTKGDYRQPKRLEKLFLKYEIVKLLIDFLKINGFIEFASGFRDGEFGRSSRMKCTKKLTRLFRVVCVKFCKMVSRHPGEDAGMGRPGMGPPVARRRTPHSRLPFLHCQF